MRKVNKFIIRWAIQHPGRASRRSKRFLPVLLPQWAHKNIQRRWLARHIWTCSFQTSDTMRDYNLGHSALSIWLWYTNISTQLTVWSIKLKHTWQWILTHAYHHVWSCQSDKWTFIYSSQVKFLCYLPRVQSLPPASRQILFWCVSQWVKLCPERLHVSDS